MKTADTQLLLLNLAPLAIIALIFWALAKWSAPAWALIVALILGLVLSGTLLGPDIQHILSQISGGHLGQSG